MTERKPDTLEAAQNRAYNFERIAKDYQVRWHEANAEIVAITERYEQQLSAAQAENATLRAALKPFANYASSIKCKNRSDDFEISMSDLNLSTDTRVVYVPIAITVGDFKRAYEALAEADEEGS